MTGPTPWHALSISEAFEAMDATAAGLSDAEARARLDLAGPNRLPEANRPSRALIVLRQFNNPLVFILFAAAFAAFFLNENTDGAFVLAVVAVNVAIGAFQEWRAETSAAALKRSLRVRPTALRGGVWRTIDIEALAPGDVVRLESGSIVPADLRLLSTQDLRIDESLLTGESAAVAKACDIALAPDTPLGDRKNMALAGTMVIAGRATGLVCATGVQTSIGSIARMLGEKGARPPLLIRMETFSMRIGVAIVSLAALLGLAYFLRGAPISEIFLLSTALAVSAIPEGLPAAITVTLAVASTRMGRRNVIVRLLPAVEALGSCTLIATDKTGTLTVNRLTAKKIVLPDGAEFDVAGEGLALCGDVRPRAGAVLDHRHHEAIERLALAGALTNEADLRRAGDGVEARGDSVDVAFLVLAEKLGVASDRVRAEHSCRSALPYEPERGFSASLDTTATVRRISVKGAPETVLAMCAGVDREQAQQSLRRLASSGYRVIAAAQGRADDGDSPLAPGDLEGLQFLGFVGLIDPLREGASHAVERARAAGVRICMITGDHPDTALAIARTLGLSAGDETALTGAELSTLSGEELRRAVGRTDVFARVEPAQKTLIVRTLQETGHFVAVTGDGVNDAPALKAAHVGVAMGASGTDVARAAADLIITDDNFASIVAGIEEGRAAYDNIRKIVWLLLATAVTEVMIFVLALMFGLPIPLTAVQILWMNLVTEGIQDVALALEGKEPGLMRRRPRKPREPIFDRQMIEQCLVIGGYVSAVSFSLFYYLYEIRQLDIASARNIVLLFLVSFHNFHAFNCRSETRSAFAVPLRANPYLILAVAGAQLAHILAMHLPVFGGVLEIAPVSPQTWAVVFALGASVVLIGEIYKATIARPRTMRLCATPNGVADNA